MNIVINGEVHKVPDTATVSDLPAILDIEARGIAIAVEGEVITRESWPRVRLEEGQRVEIVRAVQGG